MANEESEDERILGYSDIKPDTEIYRYIDLIHLLPILEGQFYVPKKGTFSDDFDACRFITKQQIALSPTPIDPDLRVPLSQEKKDELAKLQINIRKSKDFYASCWTTFGDSFLMWKAYTSNGIGVCIKSSARRFSNSIINYERHEIYCVEMRYNECWSSPDLENHMAHKKSAYSDEKEIRFYFVPPDFDKNDVDLAHKSKYPYNLSAPKGKEFSIKPKIMIDEIMLSPFIKGKYRTYIEQLLLCKYGDILKNRIKKSSLSETVKN